MGFWQKSFELPTWYQLISWSYTVGKMSTYLVLMLQEDKKLRWTQVFIRGAQSLGVGKEPNMSITPNSVRPGTVSEDRQQQNAMRVWESEMSIFYC